MAEADRRLDGEALARVFADYERLLARRRDHLNEINVFPVADADTGTNLLHTISAARSTARSSGSLAEVSRSLSDGLLLAGRGASGLILSQALIGFCGRLVAGDAADADRLAEAYKAAGLAAMDAVVDPVEGTLLTTAKRAGYAAEVSSVLGAGAPEVARAARDAGWNSVMDSPKLLPVLRDAGVVDSGAVGYAFFLDVLVGELDGVPVPDHPLPSPASRGRRNPVRERYEVVAAVSDSTDLASLRSALAREGSTVGASADGSVAKIHVHTNRVADVLEHIHSSGTIDHLEISDLGIDGARLAHVVVVGDPWDAEAASSAGAAKVLAPLDRARLLQILESLEVATVVVLHHDADEAAALVGLSAGRTHVVGAATLAEVISVVQDGTPPVSRGRREGA